jgi:CubicO group peptidase (beta-lactamase class C family)
LILLLSISGLIFSVGGQTTDSAILSQIPQRIGHFIDEQAVTLVAHGNDVVEFQASGIADIEAGRAMQKDTIFQIMSMTKPLTAVGIMMLAEEGKLALRDPVDPRPAAIHDPAKYRQGAIFPAPGWGLYSTAEDLLHFYRMVLNRGVYEGRRYLSPFSIHLMTEAHTTGIHPVGWMRGADYGLAWEVVTDPLGELAGHSKGLTATEVLSALKAGSIRKTI